jgi:RecA-family ATPase
VPKGQYQWARAPGTVAMADAPEWIVRACAASDRPEREATTVDGLELDAPEAIDRAIAWLEKDAPEAVENNGGNTTTFRVAATVKDMGISEETCFDLLVEHWNDEKALPPWSAGELEQIVGNAYVYGKQPIGVASTAAQFDAIEIGEGAGGAPPLEIADDAPSDRPPDSEPEPPLPFISAAAWHGLPIPEREWVLRDRIPMRNVTLLAGDGGVGKTILHLQAGTAIVLGQEWLGIPTEPGPVAVVCCEDDADELHRRVSLIANHNQVELSDLKNLHLLPLVDGHDTVLALPDGNGQIRPTKMFARLREAVCDIKPRLLTIDNLADVVGGNEINRVQVRQFITLLRNLAVAAGGATLLTAHPSLTGMASGSGTSGSTGWHNSARARMYMTQPKAEGGGGEPDRDLRLLKTMKSNYGPPSEEIKLRWCNGVWAPVHAIGVDRAAVAQEAESVFLALLDRFTRQGRNVSHKPGPSYAPTLFAREAEARPVGVTRKDFEAAMSRLFAGRKIQVENYGRPSRPYSRLVLVVASD